MFVTRLTDSEERVITAGRGGARGGEQGLFSPATRSSRSILGWVVSFIRRWISRACMAAHRVTRASYAHKSANLFIDFLSVPCGCQISRNQFHLHLESTSRKSSSP